MSRHRSRITPLNSTSHGLELVHWVTPPGAEALGYIERGDDQGRLLRLASGALVIQLPNGAIGTIDQRKAEAMLNARNAS